MRVNKAKAKIKAGEKAYGIAFPFKSLPLVDVVGNLGFDFIFLEAEHGFFSLPDIEEMVLMADAKGLTTLARVPNIHPSTILRFLDRGVLGIMGPHIANKEDAEALVRACRFAPRGIRSFFPSKYADYQVPDDVPAYMAKANEEVMVRRCWKMSRLLKIWITFSPSMESMSPSLATLIFPSPWVSPAITNTQELPRL